MSDIMKFVFLLSLLTTDVLSDRSRDYEDPQQGGKSFFFLGGLIRKIKSRWQNQNQPPSPYGSQPVFAGYYGCGFYNCRPPQPVQLLQAVQPIQQIQPVQPVPPVQPVATIVQTPIVVQQAQVYQPNTYAQAVSQQNRDPVYPIQPQPQPQQYQYPTYGSPQPSYASPQPTYGNLQPYQPYPMYPTAYASAIPGQIYQNAGCTYPGYLCARRS